MFSFTARKKTVDVQRHIRRMIDLTIPNRGNSASTDRLGNRHNRAIPVIVCPWKNGKPVSSECIIAITKDVCDNGVGVILNEPSTVEDVVVGFLVYETTAAEPWFFRGKAEHTQAVGGGFWLLGIALTEFMNEDWQAELAPLLPFAQQLLPPHDP